MELDEREQLGRVEGEPTQPQQLAPAVTEVVQALVARNVAQDRCGRRQRVHPKARRL